MPALHPRIFDAGMFFCYRLSGLNPATPVASFVNGDMLQVLVFAVIMGVCCLSLKETTKEK